MTRGKSADNLVDNLKLVAKLASQLHVWTLPIRILILFKVTQFSTCKRARVNFSPTKSEPATKVTVMPCNTIAIGHTLISQTKIISCSPKQTCMVYLFLTKCCSIHSLQTNIETSGCFKVLCHTYKDPYIILRETEALAGQFSGDHYRNREESSLDSLVSPVLLVFLDFHKEYMTIIIRGCK